MSRNPGESAEPWAARAATEYRAADALNVERRAGHKVLDQGYADATDRLEAAEYDREEAAIAADWQRPVNERKRGISTNIDD